MTIEIRESLPGDIVSIEAVYSEAFAEEDLLPLVRELLSNEPIVLSLVGLADRVIVGHVIFTACSIAGTTDKVALLGPLAVTPNRQKQGIGGDLVRAGLRRLQDDGVTQVYVLGDPAYYGSFGFEQENGVIPPYPLPEEWCGAWQSISLNGGKPPPRGALSLPQPWLRSELWLP